MREIKRDIQSVKQKVGCLVGRELNFEINRGRNKMEYYKGFIKNAYPSIFTVQTQSEGENELLSFSYNDILTHNVKISSGS
ncbi:MAG: Veg family protein [Clostridia bacterium]